MSEEEVNKEDDYSDVPASRKIIHEIVDRRHKPTKPSHKTDLRAKLDEREAQMFSLIEHNLEMKKELLVDKYPENSNEIEAVGDPKALEQLEARLEDRFQSQTRKPRGKATLPPTQEPNSLDSAPSHGSLINRLYKQSTARAKTPEDLRLKEKAIQKRDKLFGNLKNISLDHMTKVLRESTHFVCPSCQSITSADLGRRGASCTECSHVVGQSKIKRRW